MKTKRLVLIAAILTMMMSGFAQSPVSSVCGIKMGTDKDEAKSILTKRFGYLAVSENEGDLQVYEGSVGGISHTFMTFYFAWVNGKSKFNGAYFSTPYELSRQKDAIDHRELIKSVYEQKYEIFEGKNDDGFKYYLFGKGADLYGKISVHKGKGKDGKTRLYCDIDYYGPYSSTDDI